MDEFVRTLTDILRAHDIWPKCEVDTELHVEATRDHDTMRCSLPVAQLLRDPEFAASMVAFYVQERLDKAREARRTEMRAAVELAINSTAEVTGP